MRPILVLVLLLCLPGCRDTSHDSPLERALRSNNKHNLEQLFEHHVSVTDPMSNGESPLQLAVSLRNVTGVELLLKEGADFRVKDANGRTLFDLLWGSGYPSGRDSECIGYLLSSGLLLSQDPDKNGQTWMHRLAARCDDASIPTALVKQGFAVDGRDRAGWTPLHHAVLGNRYGFCLGLLDNKADVNAQTQSVVEKIVDDEETTYIEYQYQAGSRPLDLEHQTLTRGTRDEDITKLLVERGGTKNPEVKNKFQ